MITMTGLMALIRRRSGSVAAASAIAGFAIGAVGAYKVVNTPPPPPILLRQATEGDAMSSFDGAPGAGGMLVLLRNDGTTPIQVSNAAFARTSAAPPLYIAPEVVQPGGEVNVDVPIPGQCFAGLVPGAGTGVAVAGPAAPPAQITVSVRLLNGPIQNVQVQVVGDIAAVLEACHSQGID